MRVDARVEPHLAALLLDRAAHRLPHLAGAEARVVELRDEALDLVVLVAEERGLRGGEERQPLDALRRPLGADLGRRDAPDLLGVRLEEELEQPAAEAVRDPVLERVVDLVAAGRSAGVRRHAARQLDRAELADHVGAAQRVVEVAVVPVDPRHPRAPQELVAEHLVPERVDLDRLREEAMAAEVEAVAVALDRLRDAADLVVGLEDERAPARLAQQVPGGQTGRAAAEDERRLGGVMRHEIGRATEPRPRNLADSAIDEGLQRLEVVVAERDLVRRRRGGRRRTRGSCWSADV